MESKNKFNFYTLGYSDPSVGAYASIHLDVNYFKGKAVGYIGAEYLNIKKGVYRFITDENGKRPFTIRTLDAPDPSMGDCVLSVIPIKDNYQGVSIVKRENEYQIEFNKFIVKSKSDIEIVHEVFSVVPKESIPFYEAPIEGMREELTNAVIEGIKKLDMESTDNLLYTIDKFSYNPMRRITTRLFININGALCTMKTADGIMEISNNTPDKWKEKGVPFDSGIYRVYYYTKHNTNYKFVRGVRLPYLTREDVQGRLNIFKSMYENLVIFKTIHGEEILGAVMGKKYIILYEMNGTPHSIKLEPNEYKIIKSYESV